MLPDGSTDARRLQETPSAFLRLAADKLQVNLEPIVDTRSGRLIACEALMRGVADLGYSEPHAVLDRAAELDVLTDLELLMARKALQAITKIGHPRPRLFLNIDSRTLADWRNFGAALLFHVQSHDMSAAEIALEFSEKHVSFDMKTLEEAVQGFRSHGFRIVIDDFGDGVSCLQVLYYATPNFVKIDRFFVEEMATNAHKRTLVNAIVQMSHTLGARVIAEGVETQEELEACRQADCRLIQGYLVKNPDARLAEIEQEYKLPGQVDTSVSMDAHIRELIQTPKTVAPNVTLTELGQIFQTDDVADIAPVVDASGLLVGGIIWNRVRPILLANRNNGTAAFKSSEHPDGDLIELVAIIDIRQSLPKAIDIVANRARNGVVVVDAGTYVGYLSPYDLMQLANKVMLTEAQRRNPLSGLPGNESINETVRDYANRTASNRLVCYVDISNFKPFNDRFGFELGDRAILLLADQLKRLSDITGAFVGHIGGDDFFVGFEGEETDALIQLLEKLETSYADAVLGLLPESVRLAKAYKGQNREGVFGYIDMIRITVVYRIFAPNDLMPDPTEVANDLAQLKTEKRRAS